MLLFKEQLNVMPNYSVAPTHEMQVVRTNEFSQDRELITYPKKNSAGIGVPTEKQAHAPFSMPSRLRAIIELRRNDGSWHQVASLATGSAFTVLDR